VSFNKGVKNTIGTAFKESCVTISTTIGVDTGRCERWCWEEDFMERTALISSLRLWGIGGVVYLSHPSILLGVVAQGSLKRGMWAPETRQRVSCKSPRGQSAQWACGVQMPLLRGRRELMARQGRAQSSFLFPSQASCWQSPSIGKFYCTPSLAVWCFSEVDVLISALRCLWDNAIIATMIAFITVSGKLWFCSSFFLTQDGGKESSSK
jgi:hypothetical protein